MESVKEKKKRRIKNIIILLLLIICITIGYAMLSSNLNINGTSKIKKAIWDVHFENVSITENTNVSAMENPKAESVDKKTKITYSVNLYKPGDVYEFYVDIVNDGGIDARLDEIVLTKLTSEQDVYINYEFKHADGSEVLEDEIITSGKKDKYLVRVEYDKSITKEQLPLDIQTLPLSVEMNWQQA